MIKKLNSNNNKNSLLATYQKSELARQTGHFGNEITIQEQCRLVQLDNFWFTRILYMNELVWLQWLSTLRSGLSLRSGAEGFPLATTSMADHRILKHSRTKRTSCRCSIPCLLNYCIYLAGGNLRDSSVQLIGKIIVNTKQQLY